MSEPISTIGAAVITAIVGPPLTLVFKGWYDRRQLPKIPQDRQDALNGKWKGIGLERQGPKGEPFEFDVEFLLQASDRTVSGKGLVQFAVPDEEPFHAEFAVEGKFLQNRFVQLNYWDLNGSAIQFGGLVVQLSDDGKKLTGHLAGYGSISAKPVTAELRFTKVI